mmetsp:Transcript_24907/g.53732  ORF Transcript_24907/g.53732 Transcript_24907/m.53732 type:complete len:216 (+) Transcript_24907:296-943(+)
MGLTQTKLHFYVLSQNWNGCFRRLQKSQGVEARIFNPCGDLPLHLACYTGQAPPEIIRALIDAYPGSVNKENKLGRDPLELAAKNYRVGSSIRAEVLALLRWHRPGISPASASDPVSEPLPDIFCQAPPERMYSASAQCVVCMEEPACIAMIPCGHICLCMTCVRTAMRKGLCPVDRCEVKGLYQLQGDQVRIHESMCGVNDHCVGAQSEMEIAC